MTNNILFDNADENNGMPNFFVPSVQEGFFYDGVDFCVMAFCLYRI